MITQILEVFTIIAYYWLCFKADRYVESIYFEDKGIQPTSLSL
jgi:hypothetical protein